MVSSANIDIVKLEERHRLDSFACGDSRLNSFLKRYAKQHHFLGYSVTFLAVSEESPDALGYITVCASNIELHEFDTNVVDGIEIPNFFPMPTLHVARLAVHKKVQLGGIGTKLLRHAFRIALEAQDRLGIGIYAIDLHLAEDDLKDYYPRLGFRPVTHGSNHYYLPLATIRAAAEAAH